MIFIRIKVKGYLKNITDNELFEFNERAIKNNNKITFSSDNVKNIIKYNDNEVILTREGSDFISNLIFNTKKSMCNYMLKENNYDINIEINTIIIEVDDSSIYIKYLIVDSKCEYEYKIEMSDI